MTMEVSSTKRPSGSQLPVFYEEHKDALYDFSMWPLKKNQNKKNKKRDQKTAAPATQNTNTNTAAGAAAEKRVSHKEQIYIQSTASKRQYDCLTMAVNVAVDDIDAEVSRKPKEQLAVSVKPCLDPAQVTNRHCILLCISYQVE